MRRDWTIENIKRKGLRYKVQGDSSGESTKLERDISHEPMAKNKAKKEPKGSCKYRYHLCFTVYNNRQRDLSNICIKYHEDELVRAGIIEDDKYVEGISISQEQCVKGEERVDIEVWERKI